MANKMRRDLTNRDIRESGMLPARPTKTEMRVMATLKVHGGIVEDPGGRAVKKLWDLSAKLGTKGSFSVGVSTAEAKGLVIKQVDKTPGGSYLCRAIMLVENDDFPVAQWALDEFANIEVLPKSVDTEPKEGLKPTLEPDPEPIQSSPTPAQIAEAILERVFFHYQNPREIYVVDPNYENAMNRLHQLVDELTEENTNLKKQLTDEKGKRRRYDEGLTQKMKDFLPAEDWDKLIREIPRDH